MNLNTSSREQRNNGKFELTCLQTNTSTESMVDLGAMRREQMPLLEALVRCSSGPMPGMEGCRYQISIGDGFATYEISERRRKIVSGVLVWNPSAEAQAWEIALEGDKGNRHDPGRDRRRHNANRAPSDAGQARHAALAGFQLAWWRAQRWDRSQSLVFAGFSHRRGARHHRAGGCRDHLPALGTGKFRDAPLLRHPREGAGRKVSSGIILGKVPAGAWGPGRHDPGKRPRGLLPGGWLEKKNRQLS